ncbi:hypothetical protein CXG81DRAFT_11778 [Caulochytrium protostelioides]|uniref:Cleft lip and palate transmembrane 1 n=1 Tax=Caulochytrium protostelioides TaxID=1555241 RepID=A0A4P9X8F3_9FUNG|nr:hypothetical protein CXG81DRAFT_11778 [Caulochytrium protostelioides]|eukprot:RKP01574.1 hypothetical protein CXG81DRAFT_11778 [Caulochytrium protostelioides]
MTLITYVAESPVLRHFEAPDVQLVWRQPGLTYASADDAVTASVTVSVPPRVGQANGSLYAHTCLVADGGVCDPRQPGYDPQRVVYHRTLLTRWQPQRKERTKRRLMGGSADAAAKAPTAGAVAGAAAEAAPEVVAPAGSRDATVPVPASSVEPWVAYWWPHLTLHTVLIDEVNARLPPPVHPLIRPTAQRTHFMPVLVDNDFWLLQDQLQPINASTTALNLTLEFYPVSLSKYMLYQQFAQSFRMQQDMMGIEAEEIDRMKRLFVDTNPYLLGVTLLVSLLHSLLEFLAFRADVAFWRAKKDLAGISVRGMLLNLFCQTVIFLYLLDNETSWMILASQGAGLLVECWKMTRVVTATRQPTFPWVRWTHRQRPSRRVAQTMVYDAQAFRWLMYGVLPLLAGYMVYSAYSLTHTSWYGFCLSSAVTFIYAAGFLSMVPQLLINRALQSTSHMPGRTLAYKALSTFIDDLFAWVTKMPLLHRIATLRDDVIFLIWLYQRWIYPEDPRRANEYGQTGVDDDDDDDDDGGDNDNGDGEAKKDQ